MDSAEIKKFAKESIKNNRRTLFLISLIFTGITCGLILIERLFKICLISFGNYTGLLVSNLVFYIAIIINTYLINYSINKISLDITADKKVKPNHAFEGFKKAWTAIRVYLLISLFVFLWILPAYVIMAFVPPLSGVIAIVVIIVQIQRFCTYGMAPYIIAESEKITARKAISKSKEMMDGYKGELFFLYLSFFGWILLYIIFIVFMSLFKFSSFWGLIKGVFTIVGTLTFYMLRQYMETAVARFYNRIKPKEALCIKSDEEKVVSGLYLWYCEKCTTPNSVENVCCSNCGALKADCKSSKASKNTNLNWNCVKCGTSNHKITNYCSRCGAPRDFGEIEFIRPKIEKNETEIEIIRPKIIKNDIDIQ